MLQTGAGFRLAVETLASAVETDRDAGYTPLVVCADAGSTSTGAVDPPDAIADYCEAQGIWLHVDAAYGGFAAVTEPGARLLRGIERADSIGIDPHKWFFQPYDTGCLLVRDVTSLEDVGEQHAGFAGQQTGGGIECEHPIQGQGRERERGVERGVAAGTSIPSGDHRLATRQQGRQVGPPAQGS